MYQEAGKALSVVEPTVESIEPRDRDRANVASIIIRFYIAILLSIPDQGKAIDHSPQHWQAGSSRLPSSRVTLPAYAGPCLRRSPGSHPSGIRRDRNRPFG